MTIWTIEIFWRFHFSCPNFFIMIKNIKNWKFENCDFCSRTRMRHRLMFSLICCMIFFLPDFILMKLSLLTRFRLALKAFKNLFIFKLRKVKISPVLRSRNIVIKSMHDHKLLKALNWAFGIELILRQNGRSLAKFYVWEVKKLDEIKVHRTP